MRGKWPAGDGGGVAAERCAYRGGAAARGGVRWVLRGKWPAGVGGRVAAKMCAYLGVAAALGVLVWHSVDRRSWWPLEDNFDALTWLGILLALFVLYTQRAHPLRGLDWFLM